MASRIWITCDHEHLGPHLTRELPTAISNEGWCQGGRVLDPGSLVPVVRTSVLSRTYAVVGDREEPDAYLLPVDALAGAES